MCVGGGADFCAKYRVHSAFVNNAFTPGLVISFLAFFLFARNANTSQLLYLPSLTMEKNYTVSLRFALIKSIVIIIIIMIIIITIMIIGIDNHSYIV